MRYFLFSILFLLGCDSSTKQTFDKNAMIANITENVIIANYQVFSEDANRLNLLARNFQQDPTLESFLSLNGAWHGAMAQWKKCELFNFGVTKDKNYMFDINFNEVRPKLIDNVLKDTTTINEDYIKNLGAAAKGLPAIAFLVSDFSTLPKSKRRIAYLCGLTQNLYANANALLGEWKNTYGKEFTQNKDNNSLNVLANQLLALTENTATKRMDLLIKQYDKETKLDKLEVMLNDTNFIYDNLRIIEETFKGEQGTGFDDYLDFLEAKFANRKLSEAINEQIEKAVTGISAIEEFPVDKEKKARAAQEELKKLLVLVKTDMFSAMGIAVSFTDADGD